MLRDTSADLLFSVLTPEMIVKGVIVKGYCDNVIPSMEDNSLDPDWHSSVVSVRPLSDTYTSRCYNLKHF